MSFAGCCGEPYIREPMLGPHLREAADLSGFPVFAYDKLGKREDYALAELAPKIDAPIMIQKGDREFQMALEAEAAFQRQGKPLEIFVYPNEYHILWQPAHRQAVYAGNLAWFDHHLLGKENAWAAKVLSIHKG